MKILKLIYLNFILFFMTAVTAFAQDDWINLFNGNNLAGWQEHSGQAKYSVENGVLTGESVSGTGNSFLCTTQTFENFELEVEFKCDALLNSGVQIRSEVFPGATNTTISGKEFKFAADRIHGYQVEIDMDAARGRMWSGGLYDEARRGWLFPADGEKGTNGLAFSEQGRAIGKNGEWNKLRIVANGPTIQTWLNGEKRAEICDDITSRGVIALQVHGVGNATNKVGLKVSFRNLRIHELAPNTLTKQEKADGWKLLWNGKTTDGWRSPRSLTNANAPRRKILKGAELLIQRSARGSEFPTKSWTIENGEFKIVSSGNGESQAGGDIITRKRYANFELTADFKTTTGCNSGIKIFVQPDISPIDKVTGNPTGKGSAIGMEFQILDDVHHPDAKLGRDGDRTVGSLYDLIPAAKNKKVFPPGEWNHAQILSQGNHVEFWLNGEKTLEFERGSPEFRGAVALSKFKNIPDFGEWADGHVLLQEHGSEVSFRNVKIRELPAN